MMLQAQSGCLERSAPGETMVIVPSPRAGEGMKAGPRVGMGEGYASLDLLYPSPIGALWKVHIALSRTGRGHNDARRAG
jgi:hypothetical protein